MNELSEHAWRAAILIDDVIEEFFKENGLDRVHRSPPVALAKIIQLAINSALTEKEKATIQ